MEKFKIAGLTVQMDARGTLLYNRSRKYLCRTNQKADILLDLEDVFFLERSRRYETLTLDECRYVWTGEAFYLKLLDFNGFMLHASCVEYKGNAYLFSAGSGTGKSTHTHLWLQAFEGARIINDDKPAIRRIAQQYFAYGTPFSGKHDENADAAVPVRAIVFIERAQKNSIAPLSVQEALPLFLSQTIRPRTAKYMSILLDLLDGLLKTVPVFRLRCNMDPDAARISYEGIEKYCAETAHEREI